MVSIAHRLRCLARMAGPARVAALDDALRTHPAAGRALLESDHAARAADALAVLCDALGFETLAHTRRLLAWGDMLAEAAGLAAEERRVLALGTLVHDVGKLAVGQEVLMSPAVLDPADLDRIRMHSSLGHAVLAGVPGLRGAAELVLCHHEYHDGSGYPDGRRGAEIPRVAQVFTLVDSYESMLRDDRPYRDAVSHRHALDELAALAGVRYDAGLVQILLKLDMRRWREVAADREGEARPWLTAPAA